jgi:hypothetical protein
MIPFPVTEARPHSVPDRSGSTSFEEMPMAGLFDALLKGQPAAVESMSAHTGGDRDRAAQAYSAAVGTILPKTAPPASGT